MTPARALPGSIGKKILAGFGVALFMLLVVSIVSFASILQFSSLTASVTHSHQVLENLGGIFAEVREAESAQRGFILTGKREFLAPYFRARTLVESGMRDLQLLVADNPAQARNADEVAAKIRRRLALIQSNLELYEREGSEAARASVAGGAGNVLTEEIRADLQRIAMAERRLLVERTNAMESTGRRTQIVIASVSLLAFLLVILAGFLIHTDLTEREARERELREAKEQAETANRTKSDFLARMSHELRTPLNSVIGFSNVLLKNKSGALTPQDLTFLQRIQANGRDLLALINDILDLSKIEAGRLELHASDVDLAMLIEETVQQLADRFSTDVQLETVIPENVEPVEADVSRLKQVLINLIGNAIKFTEEGSVIVRLVANEKTREPLRIDVADTGIGIPASRHAAIFDAFEQADSSTSRQYGGTGLGLAISRALVQSMGFALHVQSTEGVGSTFSILLQPNAPEAPAPGQRAADANAGAEAGSGVKPRAHAEPAALDVSGLRGKSVLVIDDEPDARVLLSELLAELGVNVLEAAGGAEGVRIAKEHVPDAILLDLIMPNMAGWEVVRQLQLDEKLRSIPVIVVSVVAGASRGVLLGPVAFLEKPVEKRSLAATLRRELRAGTHKVLIVDDDPDALELLRLQLGAEGRDIRTSRSAREALELLKHFTPDLILLDLVMPDMNGTELLAVLRTDRRLTEVPVIVVTGKDLSPDESQTLAANTVAVLTKGARLESDLQHTLRTVIGR